MMIDDQERSEWVNVSSVVIVVVVVVVVLEML